MRVPFCQQFFPGYNQDHHHSGIALLTPQTLHYGQAEKVIEQRQQVLNQAYVCNPERFVRSHPKPQPRPTAVWINPPRVFCRQFCPLTCKESRGETKYSRWRFYAK
jgi:hypothetical protein